MSASCVDCLKSSAATNLYGPLSECMAQIVHSHFFQNALNWYVWDAKFIGYLFSNNTLVCCHNSANFGHTFSSFLNVSGLPLHSSSSNSWPFLAQWYQMYTTDISINHTEAYNNYNCWLKNLKFTCCAKIDAVTCNGNILLLHGWLHNTNILNLTYLLHKKHTVYPCKLCPSPFNSRNVCLILSHK